MKHCSIAFIVAAASLATPFASADIPPRPENLVFAPLKFEPPSPKEFRHVLKDGTVVYMAPSSEFPLVTVSITFKGGDFLDPAEVPGLAGMTAAIMRSGGTATINPADLDEQLDFLATRIGVAIRRSIRHASACRRAKRLRDSSSATIPLTRSLVASGQR